MSGELKRTRKGTCFDEAVAAQAERGNTLVLSGTCGGFGIAYLPTECDPGEIPENVSGMPGAEHEFDAT